MASPIYLSQGRWGNRSAAVQRYDVRDPGGNFVERYWQPLNSPVLNEAGHLNFILHHVINVTAQYVCRERKVA